MKNILFTLLLVIATVTAIAQIPSGYYDDAEGLNGESLKTALHEIIDGHYSQSYSSIWYHIESTDPRTDNSNQVWDMYSDIPGGTPPYTYYFGGGDQCGSYSQEGDCYNREHSFPKSWFNEGSPMNTDIFHIVPTDGYVNGQRSSYPFGETNNPSWTSENGSKRGSNSTSGFSGTIFEPIDEFKGDFARIYFYMATRYEDIISNWENNSSNADAALDGSSFQVYEDWLLDVLLDWHQMDPVSQKEIDRNNAIHDVQDNRNPFVDHPEYVNMVWGGVQAPIIANMIHSPTSPDEYETVTVSAVITDNGSIQSAVLHYGFSNTNLNNDVLMSHSGSNYTAQIPGQAAGQNVYYRILASDNESNTTQSVISQYQVDENAGFISLPFFEDFENETLGIFSEYSVSGVDQSWHHDDYNDDNYAKMSNFNGSENIANEDWLISPAINFNAYNNEELIFKSAMKDYDDFNCFLNLHYSTNYTGTGDPNIATWVEITNDAYWSTGNYEWVESGGIDLSGIVGSQVYIAFEYASDAGSGKTWQIDDVSITADPTGLENVNVDPTFVIYPNPAKEYLQISTISKEEMNVEIYHTDGSLMKIQSSIKTNQRIDISDLAAGFYFIKIANMELSKTSSFIVH